MFTNIQERCAFCNHIAVTHSNWLGWFPVCADHAYTGDL